jgi:hypothetical protein
MYIGIRHPGEQRQYQKWMWLTIFLFFFGMYLWVQPNPQLGVIALALVVVLAICFIQVISNVPIPDYCSRYVILGSSVTFELYLIHYSVITVFDHICHGKYIGYPLVFVFSITLAILIHVLSRPYKQLTTRCTGWLLRCAP